MPDTASPRGPGRRPVVLLISRHKSSALHWAGESLLPLAEADIHLVTHPFGGAAGINPADFLGIDICDFIPGDQVEAVCRRRLDEGRFTHIAAIHEKALELAAQLRHDYRLPGMDPHTTALFRDKILMKQRITETGAAAVPHNQPLDHLSDLYRVDWSRGPKVIKHRRGLGASDVHIIHTPEAAAGLAQQLPLEPGQYEIEDYIPGPAFHCDAILTAGNVVFAAVSEYLSTPADYRHSPYLGSITVTDPDTVTALTTMNTNVLHALGIRDGVTHLEAIQRSDGTMIFCEVAARPGGGAIDRAIHARHGINITQAAYRLHSGLPVALHTIARAEVVSGFLGIYPSPHTITPLTPDALRALGVIETIGRHTPTDIPPRHAADFTVMHVLTAPTPDRLHTAITQLADHYRHPVLMTGSPNT